MGTTLIAVGTGMICGSIGFLFGAVLATAGWQRRFEDAVQEQVNVIVGDYIDDRMQSFQDGIKAGRRLEKTAQAHGIEDDGQ